MPGNGERLDVATLETWVWEAACKIRGPLDAPRLKHYLLDVEPNILGRAYECVPRKFAERQRQRTGDFYPPREVAVHRACKTTYADGLA
jgi:hypothetical protein